MKGTDITNLFAQGSKSVMAHSKMKKTIIGIIAVLVACIIFFLVMHLIIVPYNKYHQALELIDNDSQNNLSTFFETDEKKEEYIKKAYAILSELGSFKDAEQLLENFKWVKTKDISTIQNGANITEYSYDLRGNCIKEVEIFQDGRQATIEYCYEEEKCIRKIETDSYGRTTTFDYVYDEQGHLIKEILSNSGDSYVYANYTYDEQGNCVEASGWEWSNNYIYNEKGNCVREEHYGEGYRDIVDYTFDENGKVIKKVNTEGIVEESQRTTTTEYFYDENGNCNMEISKTDIGYDEDVVIHEYQFIYVSKE